MKRSGGIQHREILWYLILFGLGIIFLLFFSVSTSPLTSNSYGFDSAYFQMIGQSMTKGLVMYRDIFDHKGPYFFFLQYIGQCLSYGRYGIFIVQCFSLCLTLYLADRGCRLVCGKEHCFWRVVSVAVFFLLWEFTIDCGNLSEEYSLPILFLCAYLFFRYVQDRGEHGTFTYSFVIGASFGVLLFVRATNAGFICVLVAVLFVEFLLKKQWKRLLTGIGGFSGGFLGASIPICVYYFSKGALSDMLYTTFIFNFTYAVQGTNVIRYEVIAVLAVAALTAAWLNRKERVYCLFAIVSLIGTVCMLLPGNGYIHYYQLIIPPVLGNLWLIMRKYDVICFRWKKACFIVTIAVIVLLNGKLIVMHGGRVVVALGLNTPEMESSVLGSLAHYIEVLDPYGQGMYGYTAVEKVQDIMDRISAEDRDSIFTYSTAFQFPRIAEITPYIKYCLNQEPFVSYYPQIGDEIEYLLESNPPKYIVISDGMKIQNEKMRIRLELHYVRLYGNGTYALYQLIE